MIPPDDHPCWLRALKERNAAEPTTLETKILLSRLRQDVARDPDSLQRKIKELRAHLARSKWDAETLLGQAAVR